MGSPIDLRDLALRESEQTAWKENVADIDDVVETLSAFANDLKNLGGGYVVCGAREARDEHGFPRLVRVGLTANRLKEVEDVVLARCRERVSPPITPLVEELDGDEPGRHILVFVRPTTCARAPSRRGGATRRSRGSCHACSSRRPRDKGFRPFAAPCTRTDARPRASAPRRPR